MAKKKANGFGKSGLQQLLERLQSRLQAVGVCALFSMARNTLKRELQRRATSRYYKLVEIKNDESSRSMNLDLTGRRALVCGSSQGIGLAAAIELSRLGANVTLFARNAARLTEARAKLNQSTGQQHDQLVADFTDLDQVTQVLSTWLAASNSAHILVNNTGGPPPGLAINAELNEFVAAFQNHLLVNQAIAKMLVPFMRREQFGRIINVISTSVKQPIAGLGVSNTIRGAVASWAKTLASELASDGITVNNVLPGATRTARLDSILNTSAEKSGTSLAAAEQKMLKEIPAKRFGSPEEIGAAIAFLASPAAAYINGINLPVDGGRTQCL